jgi:hypothetical protein
MEQWQWLKTDNRQKKKKKGTEDSDVMSRNLRKKRNGDTPLGYSGQTALRRGKCGVLAKSQNI